MSKHETENLFAKLTERLESRYQEGMISESLAEYFESGGEESFPDVSGQEVRKLRRMMQTAAVGSLPGGTADDLQNSPQTSCSPPANRGVTFNQVFSEQKSFGGYDGGIQLGFEGKWNEKGFQTLKKYLEEVKEASIEQANHREKPTITFEINGKSFVMSPRSVVEGSVYRYVFEGMGVKFYIHQNPKGDIQPIRICYLAVGLIGRDFFLKHCEIREFVESLGFEISNEKLSRVDMQVMINRPIKEFADAYFESRVVCTAQHFDLHGSSDNPESLTIGNDVQVCIYDKRRELEKAMVKDPIKCALMLETCLGSDFFETETPLTRVEFRLRRSILKDMGVNSVQDLLEKETSITKWLTERWFRIITVPKLRGHTSKQTTSELWGEVQAAFAVTFPGSQGHNHEMTIDRSHELRCPVKHLHAQSSGCFATAAAYELGQEASLLDVLRYTMSNIGNDIEKIYRRYQERVLAIGSRAFGIAKETAACGKLTYQTVNRELDDWFERIRRTVQLNLQFE
jgi:hypothetical protein